MKQPGWRGMMVAGCVMMLSACADSTEPGGTAEELDRARQMWESSGVDDYDMTVRLIGAWSGGTAEIEVRDGVPVAVRPGNGLSPELWQQHDTVEELFGILQQAVDEPAHGVYADFHPSLGLPILVGIDRHRDFVDDEHGFRVERFDRR